MSVRKGPRSSEPFTGWRGRHIAVDFRFNEGAGAPFDYSNLITNGSLANTGGTSVDPVWQATEKGTALHFEGEPDLDSGYAVYDSFLWPHDVLTLEFMWRPQEKAGPPIVTLTRIFASDDNFEVRWDSETDVIHSDINGNPDVKTAAIVFKDVWHHVIIVSDHRTLTSDRVIWVDDVKGVVDNTTQTPAIAGAFRLGHRSGGLDEQGVLGEIAFLRMYDDLATDDQVRAMFRDPFPELDVMSAAHLEAGIGTIHIAAGNVTLALTIAPVKEVVDHSASGSESLIITATPVKETVDHAAIGSETLSITVSNSPGQPVDYQLPESDISVGTWTNEVGSGTNLYLSIDEGEPGSDSDFVRSASTPDTVEFKLAALGDPVASDYHVVQYSAFRNNAVSMDLDVFLVEGTTIRASWTDTVPQAETFFQHVLTTGEADSITDYGDLRLRFTMSLT